MKKFSYISILLFTVFAFSGAVYAACPLGADVTKDLYGILKVIRIAAPLLVIAFTIFEAIQAITKGDAAADLKKVATRFGKRCIFAVILFFLPILIDQVMQMANVWGDGGSCDIENAESNRMENDPSNNGQNANNNNNNSTNNGQNAGQNAGTALKSCGEYKWSECPAKAENGDYCEKAGGIISRGYCKKVETGTSTNTQSSTAQSVKKRACEEYTNQTEGCPTQAENGDNCQESGSKSTGTWKCTEKQTSSATALKSCGDYGIIDCPSGGQAENGDYCKRDGGFASGVKCVKDSTPSTTKQTTTQSTAKKNCSQYLSNCPAKDDYGNTCKKVGVNCTIEYIGGKKSCENYPNTKDGCPAKDERGTICTFTNGKCTSSYISVP